MDEFPVARSWIGHHVGMLKREAAYNDGKIASLKHELAERRANAKSLKKSIKHYEKLDS